MSLDGRKATIAMCHKADKSYAAEVPLGLPARCRCECPLLAGILERTSEVRQPGVGFGRRTRNAVRILRSQICDLKSL
jgi:hypothetical protein